jgi:hypothetical protein
MFDLTTTCIILICLSFIAGFLTAWALRSITLVKIKKSKNSIEGFLKSEKLMKETIQKENSLLYQSKQTTENDFLKKQLEAIAIIKMQEQDILLLQKSNEETEALMQAGLPGLNDLKLKLLEANNTIARIKGQMELREKDAKKSPDQ